ncbi:methyl-accepting chemotaxis protein [Inhella gelatinilytica]|nr:methyl-accepting chemotaxis protein [Inhella gelatinilytica]
MLEWIRLTQQHRGLSSAFLQGQSSAAEARGSREAATTAAAEKVLRLAETLDATDLGKATRALQTDWKDLAKAVASQQIDSKQSFARHSALVKGQLDLLAQVARYSGVATDPRPVVQGLQSAALDELPRVAETLGQLRAQGTAALSRGAVTPEEKGRFELQLTLLREVKERAVRSVEQARRLGGNALKDLGGPLEKSSAAAGSALQLGQEQLVASAAEPLSGPAFFDQITRHIDPQYQLIDVTLKSLSEQLHTQAQQAQQRFLAFLTGLLVLGALASWIMWEVSRRTSQALGSAVQFAQGVAAGDLSQRVSVQSQDEVGQLLLALNQMSEQLGTLVSGVRQNADSVATAAVQIAQGNQDLSNRTEQQASALEQTAASMEQLGATVRQNADHAKSANTLARNATEIAARSGAVMVEVVQTMQGINESSRRIADIISVIDGIAFQTNILALNAAVEAARAGEQGRGFAVVASEVRSLAQRSAEAAKEIKSLIGSSGARVEQGAELVSRAGATVDQVVQSIVQLSDLMGQISTATQEQSSGVQQVGQAVSELDRTTQQNAALVEESAAAAESLQQQAQQMASAVSVFQVRTDCSAGEVA